MYVHTYMDDAYVFRTRVTSRRAVWSCSRTRVVSRLLERAWQISVSRVTRNTYVSADPGVIIQSKHGHRRGSVIHRITRALYTSGSVHTDLNVLRGADAK